MTTGHVEILGPPDLEGTLFVEPVMASLGRRLDRA